ncbi:MAG: FG-GAP repeat protein, partial [Rhodothermales bacterium]|nr:FG-GAP repeat protein [Rhodothermales bacterium]
MSRHVGRSAIRATRRPSSIIILGCWLLAAMGGGSVGQAQIYRLPNPGEQPGDFFGVSVDIEGSRAVVGASGGDSCGTDSGAAYVYEADSTTGHWNHVSTLVPDDCLPGDFFGHTLDLSGDRILVSAYRPSTLSNRPNAAYLFERDSVDGEWSQKARFVEFPTSDEGAYAVAVALDGDYAVVTTSGDPVGDTYHGAGYVYRRDAAGEWTRSQRITPSESPARGVFGTSVVVRDDVMAVGASTYLEKRPGSVYFLSLDEVSRQWKITQRFGGLDDFFLPVDIVGDRAIVGERRAGGDES